MSQCQKETVAIIIRVLYLEGIRYILFEALKKVIARKHLIVSSFLDNDCNNQALQLGLCNQHFYYRPFARFLWRNANVPFANSSTILCTSLLWIFLLFDCTKPFIQIYFIFLALYCKHLMLMGM